MKISRLAILASAFAVSGSALADHFDSRWHITPMAGYVWGDDDRGVDFDGGMGQINIGNALNEKVDLDFRLQYLDMGDTLDQVGAGLEFTWFKDRAARVTPLFTVGAGWIDNDLKSGANTDDSLVIDAGFGLQVRLNDHGIALRGDVRQRVDFAQADDYADTTALIGLVVPVGKKQTAAPVAPIDSDGDGVVDTKDACPGTAQGTPVDSTGCALDSDKDGVNDGDDLCPNTKKGAEVDATGCEQKQAVAMPVVTVYFDLNSSVLSAAGKAKLDAVSSKMVERKYIVAVATGYTDSTGSADYNLQLSRKRANAVKGYLIERGVRTANIIAKGVGEADPVHSNDSKTGREQNRRVEVRLLDQ